MSLKAMLWALYDAPVHDLPVSAFRVLLTLADHADERGWNTWPHAATIAERHSVSMSTVRRALRELKAAGLIYEGDQQLVSHLQGNRRPVVWNLDLGLRGVRTDTPKGVSPSDTPSDSGVSKPARRGVTQTPVGVSSGDTQNRQEPKNHTRARVAGFVCRRCGYEHAEPTCPRTSSVPPRGSLAALVAEVAEGKAL